MSEDVKTSLITYLFIMNVWNNSGERRKIRDIIVNAQESGGNWKYKAMTELVEAYRDHVPVGLGATYLANVQYTSALEVLDQLLQQVDYY